MSRELTASPAGPPLGSAMKFWLIPVPLRLARPMLWSLAQYRCPDPATTASGPLGWAVLRNFWLTSVPSSRARPIVPVPLLAQYRYPPAAVIPTGRLAPVMNFSLTSVPFRRARPIVPAPFRNGTTLVQYRY